MPVMADVSPVFDIQKLKKTAQMKISMIMQVVRMVPTSAAISGLKVRLPWPHPMASEATTPNAAASVGVATPA